MRTVTPVSRMKVTLFGLLLIAAAACGGDDVAGPGNGSEPDPTVDITGSWQFDASYFEGEYLDGGTGITITAVLDLQQEGGTISGTHRGGTVESSSCEWTGRETDCSVDSRNVADGPVQGTVHGNTVVLEFNADGSGGIDRYEGTLTGDTIRGDGWSAVPGTGGAGDEGEGDSELAAPTNLQAAVVETGSGPAVDLSWNDNSADEDGFAVGESCDGAEYATVAEVGPDTTRIQVIGPFPGTECTYAVVAFREDGDDLVISDPSNTATVTLP